MKTTNFSLDQSNRFLSQAVSKEELDPTSNEYQLVMGFAEYFDDLFRYSKTERKLQVQVGHVHGRTS